MNQVYQQRLARLINSSQRGLLQHGSIGLEKESLRVAESGLIAQTPHPASLGSKLMHPHITTDYSEALLEFITPPFDQMTEALRFMRHIHQYCYQHLHDELLWTASMPCVVDGDNSVRIADYGRSNSGMLKNIYRRGLGHRYGKVMQVIAGVHFNYSLPTSFWPLYQDLEQNNSLTLQDFRTGHYFAMVRNVQRFGWLLSYLFGVSPAVCKSFLKGRSVDLAEYDTNTYYLPYATSLRMSDIGYTNTTRCRMQVSHDDLNTYAAGLKHAITTLCPPYKRIGIKDESGEYRQLNANILQIENEYYSIMRPKQPPRSGERPLQALLKRGVEYVELRSTDVNMFDPMGINETQLRFLEAFLIFCLLHESPPTTAAEEAEIASNQINVARRGREPGLQLQQHGETCSLKTWAQHICESMQGICELLDQDQPEAHYQNALSCQLQAIAEPENTPSAHALAAMKESGLGFFHFVKTMSKQHQTYFQALPLSREQQCYFDDLTEQSLRQQAELEAADDISFDDYLRQYFAS